MSDEKVICDHTGVYVIEIVPYTEHSKMPVTGGEKGNEDTYSL